MLKLAFFFLCALIVGNLHGSLAVNPHNSENQCSQSIRTALEPMNVFIRDTNYQLIKSEDVQKTTQETLQALKNEQKTQMIEIQTLMDAQLLSVQTELEKQSCQKTISQDEFRSELLPVQEKMDHRFQEQTTNYGKLSSQLSAAQTTLSKQQTTLQNSLNQIIEQQNNERSPTKSISKEDLEASLNTLRTKMEGEINAIQTSLTALMNKLEEQSRQSPTSTTQKTYPAGTQQIGERFFYIEKENKQTWNKAADACQKMGGFLASIKDKTELTAITEKLKPNTDYWLGISRNKNESYVSSASGKPAGFLHWGNAFHTYERNYSSRICVYLCNDYMSNSFCNRKFFFICQFDNQV
ncbi:hypothetical protein KR084_005584 [Drosophila pseudotakahashii]|nr:hypothetical protein KR084_005584 [Drosophila pseudotakahashii]